MTGKLFLSVLVLVVIVCPSATNSQSIENAAVEREEYAVYSAVIADYAYEEKGTFIIANPTFTWSEETKLTHLQFFAIDFKDLRARPSAPAPALSQATLDDFLLRNKGNRWLAPKLEMNREYVLVDYREIKRLVSHFSAMDQEWKLLFKDYPASHGFITLSRVGFNGAMDQALARLGWHCPGLCGHGSFLLLTKRGGAWTIVSEANRWVS
jgi:hypothetical protein